eukprot:TRINITY_DN6814_c0_g1_i12.p1 TRINITY_DN6814_c0_g1~~TRINITY_DN6814_c0_g1_i12.p1  ORF type:complete len:740 (-),score=151.73 TRINITY_DN6814_c0_g1_i12:1017-3236(-)
MGLQFTKQDTPTPFLQISCGTPNKPWGIDKQGNVWRGSGKKEESKGRRKVEPEKDGSGEEKVSEQTDGGIEEGTEIGDRKVCLGSWTWERMPGVENAIQICAASDGTVWYINKFHKIFCWDETLQSWGEIKDQNKIIKWLAVASENEIWGCTSQDEIVKWKDDEWCLVGASGKCSILSVGVDGSQWGIYNNRVYKRESSNKLFTSFDNVPNIVSLCCYDEDNVVACDANGVVYSLSGDKMGWKTETNGIPERSFAVSVSCCGNSHNNVWVSTKDSELLFHEYASSSTGSDDGDFSDDDSPVSILDEEITVESILSSLQDRVKDHPPHSINFQYQSSKLLYTVLQTNNLRRLVEYSIEEFPEGNTPDPDSEKLRMYIRTSRAVLLQEELHRPISFSPVLLNMLLDGLLKTGDPVTFLQLSQLFIQYMKDRSLTEAILVCVMGRENFLSSIVEKIGLLNPVHVVNFLGQFTHFHKLSTLRPHGTPPDTISWLTNSQQFPQKFIEILTESPEDLVLQNVVSVLCDLTAPPYAGMSTHSGILAWTFAISNPSVPPGIPFMTLGGNFRTEVDDSLGYFINCPQLFWDAFFGNHMKEPYERLHEACMKSEKRLILALPLQIALLRNLSEKRESNFNALVSVAISHIDDYLSLLLDTSHLIPMAPTMTTTMASTVSTNTPTTPSMTSTLTTPFHLSPSTMISLSLSSTSHLGSSRMLILTFMMNLLEFGSGEVVQVLKDKNFFHIW